jgi:hypothetical protein
LLVRSGLISSAALDGVRAKVADQGGTIGEQLVVQGLVDDAKLTDFYKQRLLVPQVNPNTLARLPAKVVAVIPSEMAIELRAIPVSLDSDNNLTVAMSDPSDRHAVDEIAFFTGSYVVRAVATQMQIAWCLAHYYGHVTELGERLLQPEEQPRTRGESQPPPPRTRGVTGEVTASRRKGLVPGEAFVEPTTNGAAAAPTPDPDAPTPNPDAPKPRSKTASGEIRVARAPSIKPPMPDDSGPIVVLDDVRSQASGPVADTKPAPKRDSNPVIEIEADEGSEYEPVIAIGEGNESKPVPKRRRPADPDPPELAARAGEVQLATGQPIKKIEFDEPRIIIADDLNEELAVPKPQPAELSGQQTGPVGKRPGDTTGPLEPVTRGPIEPAVEVSGEVRIREHRDRAPDPEVLSSIFVELGDEDSAPVLIHDQRVDESAPVLLERRRESDVPTNVAIEAAPMAEITDMASEPIELPQKKVVPERRKKNVTQVGVGAVTAATRAKLVEPATAVPSEIDDLPTDSRPAIDMDPTRIDAQAAPPADDDSSGELLAAPPRPYEDHRDTSPIVLPPAASATTPPPSGQVRLDTVKPAARRGDDYDDDEIVRGHPTMVMSTVELDAVIPGRMSEIMPAHLERAVLQHSAEELEDTGVRTSSAPAATDELEDTGVRTPRAPATGDELDDEGWGPPGTTIPPPLLGAIPGAITPASGVIPIPDVDSAPLIVAPPVPPERGVRAQTATEAGLARALEEATARVLELIHTLDHTTDRDQIIAVMIAHLAESHRRAGFFAMRGGTVSLFAITPRMAEMTSATLLLDRPSTLADVVGTRLPYRGPMLDDISRGFLTATLGSCPPEILLVPIAVRERVVGVLFGDQRIKHTFDDQLALAARAAGMSLERLLKAKRGQSNF